MNKKQRISRHVATLSIALLLLLLGTAAAESQEFVTLKGELEAAVYDEEDGNLISVSIYNDEWGSVLISPEGKGGELLDLVGTVVEVAGTITELRDDSGFAYVIRVSNYTLDVPDEPDDTSDDEPDRDFDQGGIAP